MMAIDASALCAICLNEPEGRAFEDLLLSTGRCVISAVNLWEARVTIARRDPDPEALKLLEEIIDTAAMEVAPIGENELELAWQAWRAFGKGRHAAALNLGDCFAYATARALNAPLVYKGNDFPLTDIEAVYPPPAIKS